MQANVVTVPTNFFYVKQLLLTTTSPSCDHPSVRPFEHAKFNVLGVSIFLLDSVNKPVSLGKNNDIPWCSTN